MKTESLIELLARGAGPAPRAEVARRLVPAAMAGLVASVVLAVLVLDPIPGAMYATPTPWLKIAYAAALAVAAGWLTAGLSRPVVRPAAPRRLVLAVLAGMGLLGAVSLSMTPPGERLAALLGHTWLTCPWGVLALSIPGLGVALWAMRSLAPTRLRAAGFAAGTLAGAVGAFGYALACPETSPAFVALWYTSGIGLTSLLGAALGPRLLRW